MEADLAAWIVRQWKRRGIVDSPENAWAWFIAKPPEFQAVVRRRFAHGWQAPKGHLP